MDKKPIPPQNILTDRAESGRLLFQHPDPTSGVNLPQIPRKTLFQKSCFLKSIFCKTPALPCGFQGSTERGPYSSGRVSPVHRRLKAESILQPVLFCL